MKNFPKVAATIKVLEENYAARQARVIAAFKESNSEIFPTQDVNGRFHSPCDGYSLPDSYVRMLDRDYSGVLFAAGEYLPEPVIDEDHFYNRKSKLENLPTYKQRVKAPLELIEQLKAENIYRLEVGFGRAWNEGGTMVAYAYLEGLKTLVDAGVIDLSNAYNNLNASKAPEVEIYLEGKHTVTGVVEFTKIDDTGLYGPVVKMMVKSQEGHKFFGTMPKALPMDSVGKKVSFSATFKPGRNGLTYYTRPTQAEILEN